MGYLFTSRALMIDDSASVRFRHLVDRFRIICLDHSIREADQWTEFDDDGKRRKGIHESLVSEDCHKMETLWTSSSQNEGDWTWTWTWKDIYG